MNQTREASDSSNLYAGVDVGGTNIKIGIVNESGKIVAQSKFPTEPDKSPSIAIEKSKKTLGEILAAEGIDDSRIKSVGLGTPGPLDLKSGTILTPTNLPGWRNFPIRDELSSAVGKPAFYANDAGAAAFGEYWAGAGKEHESMILITLGTGVGGGIIVNDFSIDGAHSMGAEIGHMTIDTSKEARTCGCGHPGHLEAYASATAVAKRAREGAINHRDSLLNRGDNEDAPITSLSVYEAAVEGDKFAKQLISDTAFYLGNAISTLAHIIDPSAVLLGGAMNFGGPDSPIGQQFLREIRTRVENCTFTEIGKNITIDFATLGSAAGVVGAAGIARYGLLKSAAHS